MVHLLVVSSLASLATISVTVIASISTTLATLAAVVIWFRYRMIWLGMNRLRLRPVRAMVWLDDVILLIRFIPATILMVVWVIDFMV
jgi:hypothetical protein